MPISLPPISRRHFLTGSLAAGASILVHGASRAAAPADPHRFALFSDTHIAEDQSVISRNTNMAQNLAQAVKEVQSLDVPPASVLVDGDCAFLSGTRGDYATLVELLRPLREGGVPVHLALGNHDHRGRFWEALPREADKPPAVAEKHVLVIESPRANFVLLDSLDETNKTPGVLGETQLAWLGKKLDEHAGKPALVFVHHNPDDKPKPSGLTETKALLDLLVPRKHVKALVFGHTHNWAITEREGLHLVNLPPVAYPFAAGKPNGWVDLKLAERGAVMELHCIDPQHAQHGQTVELVWR